MPGTLFVVATPIGNLEDITLRALRVLREVDLIAVEDTRRTSKLLAHYEIRKPLVSLHEHNEMREAPRLVARLLEGASIAVVSDAGTPGISDPGAVLVRQARAAGIMVSPIPGPSAIAAALSVSGLREPEFTFMGFPPGAGAARSEWFEQVSHEPRAVVFFEAPHRIRRTLDDIARFAERPIHILREASKINEELVESPKSSVVREEGEFVCVLAPATTAPHERVDAPAIVHLFDRLVRAAGLTEAEALRATAAVAEADVRAVRKAIKKQRILVKRQTGSVT
jgi:16S rRNA (cytidine1402-2'-O)-methyltransferase